VNFVFTGELFGYPRCPNFGLTVVCTNRIWQYANMAGFDIIPKISKH